MKHIEVVAAVVVKDGKCLCTKRNLSNFNYISYKYEFPGGKVEWGETAEEALSREMFEELSVEVKVHDLCLTVEHTYPDFKVRLHAYYCELITEEIQLHQHIEYVWLSPPELEQLDWAAADLPIVKLLMGEKNDTLTYETSTD